MATVGVKGLIQSLTTHVDASTDDDVDEPWHSRSSDVWNGSS